MKFLAFLLLQYVFEGGDLFKVEFQWVNENNCDK